MNQFEKLAQDYLRQGFSVIPLRPRDKRPLIDWKGFQTVKATPPQIKSWWRQTPNANIGIVTGKTSNIVVIDCDSKEATEAFMSSYLSARDTLQVKTGRGAHFYFRWTQAIPNSAGSKLEKGIDVRSDGGYVVAPPSVHPNGKKYGWVNTKAIKPLPKALKELLVGSRTTSTDEETTYLAHGKLYEGKRNNTLTSLAGAMRAVALKQARS